MLTNMLKASLVLIAVILLTLIGCTEPKPEPQNQTMRGYVRNIWTQGQLVCQTSVTFEHENGKIEAIRFNGDIPFWADPNTKWEIVYYNHFESGSCVTAVSAKRLLRGE